MHVMMDEKRNVLDIGEERLQTPVHPGSETLRRAIRANIVSFPSQIPTLLKQPSGGHAVAHRSAVLRSRLECVEDRRAV